jgi:hypothetical protein
MISSRGRTPTSRSPTHVVEESSTHNNIPQTNPNFEISNPTPTHLAQETALIIKPTISTQCIQKIIHAAWISGKIKYKGLKR